MMHRVVESMIGSVSARKLRDGIIGHMRMRVLHVMRRSDEQDWLQVQRLPRTRAGKRVNVRDVSVVHCADVTLIARLRLKANVSCGEDKSERR